MSENVELVLWFGSDGSLNFQDRMYLFISRSCILLVYNVQLLLIFEMVYFINLK